MGAAGITSSSRRHRAVTRCDRGSGPGSSGYPSGPAQLGLPARSRNPIATRGRAGDPCAGAFYSVDACTFRSVVTRARVTRSCDSHSVGTSDDSA